MDSSIVQILDKEHDKFLKRYIFGLNIFHVNKVTDPNVDDLRLKFLRIVCEQNQVSANTGSLYDFGNTPEELFGSKKYLGSYKLVKIGCYGGKFYDSKDWNLFPPLFFSQITSEFINLTKDDESLIFNILYSDALALFIAPKTNKSNDNLLDLLNSSFSFSDSFIEEAAKFYHLVMTTQADGDYFTIYSQTVDALKLLEMPLNKTMKCIEESSWYKNNASKLTWDGKYSMCLSLE